MTTPKETRLRRLEQRAQVGNDAPVKVTRIIICDPGDENSAEIWRDEEGEFKPRVGTGPIEVIKRIIVSPPARDPK
jgi:hypothetical protein